MVENLVCMLLVMLIVAGCKSDNIDEMINTEIGACDFNSLEGETYRLSLVLEEGIYTYEEDLV